MSFSTWRKACRSEVSVNVLLGVDVGASTISGGLVTDDGEVLAATERPTHVDGPGTALATLVRLVDDLRARAETRGLSPVAIGVGLPGIVDAERGVMVDDGNYLPELARMPVAERLVATTGLPVFADNDVNAHALGAWMFGPGRGARSLLLLAIGTGIGGGVIVDGILVRGARSCAGEIGHITVDRDGSRCACGRYGCAGALVGGRAIEAEARRRAAAEPASALLGLAGGRLEAITPRVVFAAASRGDRVAASIVDRVLEALGAALGAAMNVLDPELIIVTGGVANSLVGLEAEVRRHTARFTLPPAFASARILIVPSGKHETVRGGAALARYEHARRTRTVVTI
jgi:glucokinase